MNTSDRSQKQQEQRICNCRNSKCMKLYCECFAARQPCTKLCRCFDCQNHNITEREHFHKNTTNVGGLKTTKQEGIRESKGCSCRKSFCIKKYCQCYQEGVVCGQHCKCIDCQNNESMTNRNVLINLKKKGSATSSNNCSLYPIILSQSTEHLHHLIDEQNSLNLGSNEVQGEIAGLFTTAAQGNVESLLNRFVNILKGIDNKINKMEIQEKRQAMEE